MKTKILSGAFLLFCISLYVAQNGISFSNESPVSLGDSVLYTDVTNSNLPISTVSGPGMDVDAADFDSDGDLDVVIAREFAPNVLLLNDGNGLFTNGTAGRLPQFNYDSEDIGIADFDLDGDFDIIFASEDNAVHEFYLNDGNAVFTNANNRLPNSITNGLLVIDLNFDGYPDLIFGNSGAGNPATPTEARVLINNQNATFRDETSQRFPVNLLMIPQDIKAGDIDGDSDLDLIFGNETGNRILINNGTGIYTDETLSRLPLTGTEETRKVTLADIDADKDLDLFFANVAFRAGMLRQDRLLINNGSGVFTDETSSRIPFDDENTMEGIFLDVDFDDDLDLITANVFVNRPVKIFTNNGSGFFEERTTELLPANVVAEGLGFKPADFNNDDLIDIYVVHRRTAQSLGNDRLLFRIDTVTVGVNSNSNIVPDKYVLHQNHPNPFNPTTKIHYYIPFENNGILPIVLLKIYDVLGNEVATLVNKKQSPGSYSVQWDATKFPSGTYFYKLSSPAFEKVMKMVLTK